MSVYNISRSNMINRSVALPMYYIRGGVDVYIDCTEDLVIECVEQYSEALREGYDTIVNVSNQYDCEDYMIMVNMVFDDWRS